MTHLKRFRYRDCMKLTLEFMSLYRKVIFCQLSKLNNGKLYLVVLFVIDTVFGSDILRIYAIYGIISDMSAYPIL